jgi:hypothetical protein
MINDHPAPMRMCGLKTRSEKRLPVMTLAQHFRSTRGDEAHILYADKSKDAAQIRVRQN